MIGAGAGRWRNDGLVAREVRVQRLAVMMRGLMVVEVHVHQWRGNRATLHEDDKGGRRQPSKHTGIVVKEPARDT